VSGLRAILRAASLGLVTGGLVGVWLLGRPFAALAGAGERWRTRVFRTWGRWAGRGFGLRVRVRGAPPAPPFLLVSNHLSYLDIVLLASQLDCVFVSKAEVADWPVLGWLARRMDTVFLDRGRKRDLSTIGAEIVGRLERGQGVVLFPEGTSTCGAQVGAFRPSLLEPAAREHAPVWWAVLRYETPPGCEPAWRAVAWWGGMTLMPHFLALLRLPSIRADLEFGDQPVRDPDRKALAAKLQRAVAARFLPMTETREACIPIGT